MKIFSLVFFLIVLGLGQMANAEQPSFYGGELVLVESAIEAYRVKPVVAPDDAVIEIRVSECEKCSFTTYTPSKTVEFFVEKERVDANVAEQVSSKYTAVVLMDRASNKVNSVHFNNLIAGVSHEASKK